MTPRNGPGSQVRRARGRPRDWHDKTAQNTIKSLDRAMAVFEYLSTSQGKALSDLAADTGQSPATVYRILITLEGRGLVEFDAEDQVWHIGPQAFVIGSRFLHRTSLVDRARPVLRRLMQQTGETANLGVEQNGQVLFVSQVEAAATIRAFFAHGTLSPMHSSGIGKALLAHMATDWLDDYFKNQTLEVFTDHTITDPKDLRADLAETRTRGFAIDGEEKNLGMRCIAAPVFDMNHEVVAGISVSGPTSRIAVEQIDTIGAAVIEAAQSLSQSLGG